MEVGSDKELSNVRLKLNVRDDEPSPAAGGFVESGVVGFVVGTAVLVISAGSTLVIIVKTVDVLEGEDIYECPYPELL